MLSQQVQQSQMAQYQANLQAQAEASRDNYIQQGYDTNTAQTLAGREAQLTQAQMQSQMRAQQFEAHLQGKYNAAMQFGKKYGVDSQELMQFETPQSMETHARTQGRLKAQEAEITSLKQGRIPSSRPDSSQPSPNEGSSRARRLDAFNQGEWAPKNAADWAEIEALINAEVG